MVQACTARRPTPRSDASSSARATASPAASDPSTPTTTSIRLGRWPSSEGTIRTGQTACSLWSGLDAFGAPGFCRLRAKGTTGFKVVSIVGQIVDDAYDAFDGGCQQFQERCKTLQVDMAAQCHDPVFDLDLDE